MFTFQEPWLRLVTGLEEQSDKVWKTEAMEHSMEGRKKRRTLLMLFADIFI